MPDAYGNLTPEEIAALGWNDHARSGKARPERESLAGGAGLMAEPSPYQRTVDILPLRPGGLRDPNSAKSWKNPGNALIIDGGQTFAEYTMGVGTFDNAIAFAFQSDIPTGATIDRIELHVSMAAVRSNSASLEFGVYGWETPDEPPTVAGSTERISFTSPQFVLRSTAITGPALDFARTHPGALRDFAMSVLLVRSLSTASEVFQIDGWFLRVTYTYQPQEIAADLKASAGLAAAVGVPTETVRPVEVIPVSNAWTNAAAALVPDGGATFAETADLTPRAYQSYRFTSDIPETAIIRDIRFYLSVGGVSPYQTRGFIRQYSFSNTLIRLDSTIDWVPLNQGFVTIKPPVRAGTLAEVNKTPGFLRDFGVSFQAQMEDANDIRPGQRMRLDYVWIEIDYHVPRAYELEAGLSANGPLQTAILRAQPIAAALSVDPLLAAAELVRAQLLALGLESSGDLETDVVRVQMLGSPIDSEAIMQARLFRVLPEVHEPRFTIEPHLTKLKVR